MSAINDLPATTQARMLASGELSARELLDATLDRVAELNPTLNAVVSIDEESARAAAAAADEAHAAGRSLGPLHGLPLAVKDLHATAGMRTTFGSPAFEDNVPDADELVVARMRAAGAIVFGKTNVPEFGAGSHTFNPVFGLTRNPYAPDRSAGGSSGGAAAALAAGLTSLADGSDMGGSLRNPASFCNVVGHRPSPGRVPAWPSKDAWFTLGVQGPMGRTVTDTALLLSVQAGPDERAPLSLPEPGSVFATGLPTRLDGLRIAVSPDLDGRVPVDAEVAAIVEAQVDVLRGLGAEVVSGCPDLTGAEEVFQTFRALYYAQGVGDLIDAEPGKVKQAIHWNVAKGRALTGADVATANRLRTELFHRVRAYFSTVDAVVLPASQALPFDAGLEYPKSVGGSEVEDYLHWMRAAYLISATECPATAVPAGFTGEGLPVGVQVVTAHRADLRALGIAHALEKAGGHTARRPG
ncbi:amidase [Amycolatopsis roodepoortensis]|uniref:Amidase n=1 Tax=Amycolatopsis roodepoortensis TaxID=700274 RepID=A0ABR9L1Z2_9PSEU|nr:amidase [Amycolatopsis roodepoortensis]MBE1574669.1 amidase [Amycolatopsis roodepoortensis]